MNNIDTIENVYKHFFEITHDKITAALLTLASQLTTEKPKEEE